MHDKNVEMKDMQ